MCVKKRESIVKCKDRIYDVSNTQYCSDTSGDCIVHNCSADDIVHNCSDLYKKNPYFDDFSGVRRAFL